MGRLIRVAVALVAVACGHETAGPGYQRPPPPALTDPGIAITPTDEVRPYFGGSELVWAAGDSEIFYISLPLAGPFTIKAVNVVNRTLRTVDGRDRRYYSLRLSPDGRSLYYLASRDVFGGRLSLYQVSASGGDPSLVADSTGGFVPSPDTVRLAYVRAESIFIYNVVAKSKSFLTLGGAPIAFSPDGSRLLYGTSPCNLPAIQCPQLAITLGSHATDTVALGLTAGEQLIMERWDSDGVRILFGRLDGYFVRNVTTNTTTKVATPPSGEFLSGPLTWSADGRQIAYWTEYFSLIPRDVRWTLHRTLASGQQAETVAVIAAIAGESAFAADGKRIAYVNGSQIYLKDTP